MKIKSIASSFVFLLITLFAFVLTACDDVKDTINSIQNEYGVIVEGTDFDKYTTIVSNEINEGTEKWDSILNLLKDESYNKDEKMYIFDIYLVNNGVKIQPNEKVKVTIPMPTIDINRYVLLHIKSNNEIEKLTPTFDNGKISFETESFSYFVLAQKEMEKHTHNYKWIEAVEPTCVAEGVMAHYHCEECGKNFDPNYGEAISLAISKKEHDYGWMYYALKPNFWQDGNIAYYQCSNCNKYFDEEYNEVESVIIPRLSTNLSICVNGIPTPLIIEEQDDSHIIWTLEGLSVTKGDVITLCQTNNLNESYDYFAEGNVSDEKLILTTASSANVMLYASPNGLMLNISGYKYDGVVIEINDVQYPMEYTTYLDEEITTYIYGYVYLEKGDKVIIRDNKTDTVYDFNDLSEDYKWNTWDFTCGDNNEFVIEYTGRYGFEFDYNNEKKIFINKAFEPLHGNNYQLVFSDTSIDAIDMNEINLSSNQATYNDLLWYLGHEKVVNNSDILTYIESNGIFTYSVKAYLDQGTKFNIKNLTTNSIINSEHLSEVYVEEESITKNGDYVEILKDNNYKIVYLPCYNAFSIEAVENESTGTVDAYMYLDGSFIPLTKDSNNIIKYEDLVVDEYTNIMFTNNTYTVYLPITISDQTNSSYAHVSVTAGMSMLFFDKAGTYDLIYNMDTGIIEIISKSLETEDDTQVKYLYFVGVIDYANGNSTKMLSKSTDNENEYCYKGLALLENNFMFVLASAEDGSSTSYFALENTNETIAIESDSFIIIKASGTYDIYFNIQTKTIRIA